ncbi:MAG: PBP1A family penicillin-binding protein [Deltaproteobacteria bacterium]|nr:PBP1A family penicillin-binding protein [Deltaproteobacteria bacterium]
MGDSENKAKEEPAAMRIEVITANPRIVGGYGRRLARYLYFLLCLSVVTGLFAGAGAYIYFASLLPNIDSLHDYKPRLPTIIYDETGRVIGQFGEERREIVPFEKVPKLLIQAFIASEDSSFYEHSGIDYISILRAAWENLKAGRVVQGGSTLTQQVAKSFLSRERSLKRKIMEAILARRLESKLSKQDILFLYLSQIFLGHKAYGVQAAAKNYFGKNVWDLNLAEMTLIAGLPQAPSKYSPSVDMKAAKERQKYVLRRMVEEGFIDQKMADEAFAQKVEIKPVPNLYDEIAPYFTEYLRNYIQEKYGKKALLEGGLKVYGTVDTRLQDYARKAISWGLHRMDKRQGFRGPLAHLASQTQRLEFLKKTAERYKDALKKGEVYVGLVTRVDDDTQAATVRVGNVQGVLPLRGMWWARKPNPEKTPEADRIEKVSQALSAGDVILVEPTDYKSLFGRRPRTQEKAESTVFELYQEPIVQGALYSVEPDSGYVKAMIGGYDFDESRFNRAIQACRQPGSAFKPIVYSAALSSPSKKYTPSTVVIDSPIVTDDLDSADRWKPSNYGEEFMGDLTFREALVESRNIPSVKILVDIGIPYAIEFAHKLGIKSPLKEEPGLVLGSSCVTMEELASVYGVFVRGGTRMPVTYVRRIFDRHGRILEDHTVFWDELLPPEDQLSRLVDALGHEPKQILSPQVAYIITKLLREVVQMGTGVEASRLGLPAGGKTGTTNDQYDAWFMGFTKDLLTSVWIGHDHYERPLGKWETGGKAALPIWLRYMKAALKGRPPREFRTPEGIVFRKIDRLTGLLARPDTRHTLIEAYIQGTEPKEYTHLRQGLEEDMFFKHDLDF